MCQVLFFTFDLRQGCDRLRDVTQRRSIPTIIAALGLRVKQRESWAPIALQVAQQHPR